VKDTLAKDHQLKIIMMMKKSNPNVIIRVYFMISSQEPIDVYGHQIEPICSYGTYNHKFSTHRHSPSAYTLINALKK
jgi:hypothetical protein